MSASKTVSPSAKPKKEKDPLKETKALVKRLLKSFESVLDDIMENYIPVGKKVLIWIGGEKHEFTDPTMSDVRAKVKKILEDLLKEFGPALASA